MSRSLRPYPICWGFFSALVVFAMVSSLATPLRAAPRVGGLEDFMPIDPEDVDPETLSVRKAAPPPKTDMRIIINIPARKLRVYKKDELVLEVPTGIGRRVYPNFRGNTKTRVGEYRISSWRHFYRSRAYPTTWDKNEWRGAFGTWTARLAPKSAYQHVHGTIGPLWLGDFLLTKPGPRAKAADESFRAYRRYLSLYEYGFSHGCTRVANKDIARVQKLCPIGTPVRKIYCLHERFEGKTALGPRELILPNVYHYKDLGNGVYWPETGKLEGYTHPADAAGPA